VIGTRALATAIAREGNACALVVSAASS
jgi:hypothetical protein